MCSRLLSQVLPRGGAMGRVEVLSSREAASLYGAASFMDTAARIIGHVAAQLVCRRVRGAVLRPLYWRVMNQWGCELSFMARDRAPVTASSSRSEVVDTLKKLTNSPLRSRSNFSLISGIHGMS